MNKPALILAGAECVWTDVAMIEEQIGMAWPGIVVAVNDAGSYWNRHLDHWCTLHPEFMSGWLEHRESMGMNRPEIWSIYMGHEHDCVDRVVRRGARKGGSSTLFALGVALDLLEVPGVILCGAPMDMRRNHFTGTRWTSANRYFRDWEKLPDEDRARVRSMSGKTKELLGAPDEDWLRALDIDLST